MAAWTAALFFFTFKAAFWAQQVGACRPFCSESKCVTVHEARVDFAAAEEACRRGSAELAAFQPEDAAGILAVLSGGLRGNVWIGLRLPAGACSDLSAPLRGYKWTSAGGLRGGFLTPPGGWEGNATVCSPRCVSLSSDQRWAERACSDKVDGYLCGTTREDACEAQGLSDSRACSSGPCQHICKEVKGGFRCSCFTGYIPDSKDPKQCKLHCAQEKCPAVCESGEGEGCEKACPDGFVISEGFCIDLDECANEGCDHECSNSYGSFACTCREGFVLKDTVKCVEAATSEVARPTEGASEADSMAAGASSSSGGFLWLWILMVLAVVAAVFMIRFYVVRKQKCRNFPCRQQPSADPR